MPFKKPKDLKTEEKTNKAYVRSKSYEAETALSFGGKKVPRSGAGLEKGDIRVRGVIRGENKSTSCKSFSIKRDTLDKIRDATFSTTEEPVLFVEFLDDKGMPERQYAVITQQFLLELLNPEKDDCK